MAAKKSNKPTSHVGVIYVHGIGQQAAFEHLEHGAADLILALRAREPGKRITAGVNTTADASFSAGHQTWRAEDIAPIIVDVKDKGNEEENGETVSFTRFELREVWWADLDEKATWGNFVRFLWWGCTLWATRPYSKANLDGFKEMFLPRARKFPAPQPGAKDDRPLPLELWSRAALFFFAQLFLLVLPTWVLLGLVLQRFGIGTLPTARILLQYLGDVKLYGQKKRNDLGSLADIGTPPRFVIRRRFIRALIDTANGPYDRWYVLAHSLGSVVALNGLVEPDHALPNYLDERRWNACVTKNLAYKIEGADETEIDEMRPARPAWLDDSDAIDRKKLFEKFCGLLTYGSPLDKFAALFPATVPLNRDLYVFPKRSEWVNVYEPTDPISANLDFYGKFTGDQSSTLPHKSIYPDNYAVATWPIAFWSHITYFASFFTRWRHRISPLADAVQNWVIYGGKFQKAFETARAEELTPGKIRFRANFQRLQILAFYGVTLLLLARLSVWAVQLAETLALEYPWLATQGAWLGWLFRPIWWVINFPLPSQLNGGEPR